MLSDCVMHNFTDEYLLIGYTFCAISFQSAKHCQALSYDYNGDPVLCQNLSFQITTGTYSLHTVYTTSPGHTVYTLPCVSVQEVRELLSDCVTHNFTDEYTICIYILCDILPNRKALSSTVV